VQDPIDEIKQFAREEYILAHSIYNKGKQLDESPIKEKEVSFPNILNSPSICGQGNLHM
jgi:hypothetical protein